MKSLPLKIFTLGLAGLCATVLIFWFIIPGVLHWKITKFMRLEEGNELWKAWTGEVDAEIYFKVYVYNVTNPKEISLGGIPKLQSIGPYVYEEKRTNIVLKINPERNTIKYQPKVLYYFRPDLSNGTETDVITILNVPIVGIGHELTNWSKMFKSSAKYLMEAFDETLFVRRTIKQAFFEGVHMDLIESISNLVGSHHVPSTFGYFYGKNGTLPYDLEIISGVEDSSRLGEIVSYKGQTQIDVWGEASCNMINGSDTSLNPPFLTKESVLWGFEPDVCRSIHLVYDKEEEYFGIPAYRFVLPKSFYNSSLAENQCYCVKEDKSKTQCPPDGALSVSACKWGSPLLISHPYFMYGDSKYNTDIGLSPADEKLHESFVIIEPITGAVLTGTKKMQVNIQMKRSKYVPQLNNITDVVIPLFWAAQEVSQPRERIRDIRWRLVIPLTTADISKWIMLSFNCILTVFGVSIFLIQTKDKKPIQYY